MNRLLFVASIVLGSLGLALTPAVAQEATPATGESILAGIGYPELTIRVSNERFDMPSQVPAGRTLITLQNVGVESRHSLLLRVPETLTVGDLVIDPGQDAPPAWFLDSQFVGFPGETLPGQTNRAVVDLIPGLYLAIDDFSQPFLVVPAGGEATPAAVVDPIADAKVSLFEYGFAFPETLSAGRQVWEVTNAGREPHEILLVKAPEGTTIEQVLEALMSESDGESATPSAGGPNQSDLVPVGGLGWLSQGGTAWTEVNLDAGTYGALCFVFDPATGMPHALMGMVDVFTVA